MVIQRVITFGCGHSESIHLVGTSQASQKIMQLLHRSLCPACQRRSRYAAAYQCALSAGLLPLHADCRQHQALAEIVRVALWRALLPSSAGEQPCHLLAALFNQQTQASFWIAMRGWILSPLTPEQSVSLFLRLLSCTEKEKPYEQK